MLREYIEFVRQKTSVGNLPYCVKVWVLADGVFQSRWKDRIRRSCADIRVGRAYCERLSNPGNLLSAIPFVQHLLRFVALCSSHAHLLTASHRHHALYLVAHSRVQRQRHRQT